jgi:gliding motility-associated-like protein
MIKKHKVILIILFFAIKISSSFAQIDTVFWFAAPWVTPDHWWKDEIKLHISTFNAPNTVVRVRQPAATAPNKYDTTINIPANSTFNFTFLRDRLASGINFAYDSLETRPGNTVVPYGLYISATSTITVVYDEITRSPSFLNPETFSMKGQNGLGTEFVCPFQTSYRNKTLGGDLNGDGIITQPKQQINIVATQPNTIVWITPRCPVVGHPLANVTYSVLLPSPGSAYTCENAVQNTYVSGNSLSGSVVVSDKPIAVTVADDSVNSLNPSLGCYDLMGDQIVPVDIVGKDYILNLGQLAPGMFESVYIVGTENFTQLTINNGVTTTTLINKGDTYAYNLTTPLTYVHASKNVYVLHASGYGCELGEAILPPLNCAGSDRVSFARNNSDPFFLNILCKVAAINSFTLSNASTTFAIPSASFFPVPGTATLQGGPYYGAQLGPFPIGQIPVNSSGLSSNLLFNSADVFALGIFNGTQTGGALYHYMSSFLRKTIVSTATLAPMCVGQNTVVSLTGTVSGGAISGIWSSNGSGSFGTYTSTNNIVSTTYSFSVADTTLFSANSHIKFYLTSIGDCKPIKDSVTLQINQKPSITVGSGTLMCKNNIIPVILTGTISNAISGLWGGGNGGIFGPPGPISTYTPSQADLAANTITLNLTSQGPQAGCVNAVKTITVGFINPPLINVGTTPVVCTNTQSFVLNGTIGGVTNTGIWTTNGTGLFFPNNASPTVTYQLSQSDYVQSQITLTLTSTNNGLCASETGTMLINIIPKPTVAAPNDFTVCASAGAITLTGSVLGSATSGSWTTVNGTGSFTQTPPTNADYSLSQNDTLSGNVTFVLNSYGGNCPSETDTVLVNVLKRPVINVNPDVAGYCENSPIALTGTVSGYTNLGIWSSSGTGIFTPTNTALGGQYFPSVSDISNGSVLITLTTLNPFQNCGSNKSFMAIFVKAPEAIFYPSSARCLGSPIVFSNGTLPNGTSNLTYSWDFGDGAPGGSSTKEPIYTYTNTGIYVITLTVTGASDYGVSCPDTASKSVLIKALPVADFSITSACQNLPTKFTNLSFTPPQTEAIYRWQWTFGDGTSTITGLPTSTVVHTYTSSVSYNAILTVTTIAGCVSDPKIRPINILPEPKAEFGMTNNPSVVQEPVYFSDFTTPTGNIVSWFWDFGDEGNSFSEAPVHSYQQAGVYNVLLTVTDAAGCKDTLSKLIEISLLPQVPTGFTPNNDGENDLLFVKGGPFVNLTFRVYNNWGEMLFETRDQKVGWDGKKNGVDQPVGVYIWTLVVDMYNNRQVKKNGDITLIR